MYKYAYIHISSLPLSVPVIIRQPVYRVEGKFCLRHGTRIHLRHKDCGFSITSKLVLLHFLFFEKKNKNKNQRQTWWTTMVHVGAELNASAQVRVLRSLCRFRSFSSSYRSFHALPCRSKSHKHIGSDALDPRLDDLGKVLRDEYAVIRDHYGKSDCFLSSCARGRLVDRPSSSHQKPQSIQLSLRMGS